LGPALPCLHGVAEDLVAALGGKTVGHEIEAASGGPDEVAGTVGMSLVPNGGG
jgi:hypothetical protein